MGHVELSGVSFDLPDGRPLLHEISFRVGDGAVVGLIGPNGAGKTTLLRLVADELTPSRGSISRSGGLGVMRQFIGSVRDDSTVSDLLYSLSPQRIRDAAAAVDRLELELMTDDAEAVQLAYAAALAEYADAGGYDAEVIFDACCTAALGIGYELAKYREVNTLSGGEQKRLALEVLLRGPDEVLILDEPDNYLDVPGKRWLEEQLRGTQKTVLLVSHDRELLARATTQLAVLELGRAGNTLWVHHGGYRSLARAREQRFERFAELRRRWDEEYAKLREQMLMYKQKAAYNSDMASRYQAAQTRLDRFEQAGPPEAVPLRQQVSMRLAGGRTAKRAVVCEDLELTGLMQPFDTEIWFGDRVGVLGSNGSGKSHFLRLLARGGSDPGPGNVAVDHEQIAPVASTGVARLGSRVRPGWFAQTHHHPELLGRTLLDILHRGDEHRDGLPQEPAARALDRYELARSAEQPFETLSGGQQARLQILLLELGGATLLLLDEPTDNLDIESAEALEHALAGFEGSVLAVTHDRWFARSLDRFLVFTAEGRVIESDEPIWDETRVRRVRG
ncbi:ABC-F family ATP-binding cassette domain-containing protein [Enemella evansiae]|uniref:ABC transporter n=1 Tax=Enemella evansiae TaxID=2016499 RepID=A0A255GGG8_9ACTN|nr:ATP-binding cassette domain-containing protein [Enemella evansiae]OYO14681.1 ABC transporter [Enemella evansiae]TDO93738.1 ATPase subunit of ABC transporter with duplicated ATPase domains [Enemella evansiae]